MTKTIRIHSAQFKFRVALEALGELKTINQIASEYEIHPTQVRQWKKRLKEGGADIFANPVSPKKQLAAEPTATEATLYEQIGRLKMELEWLKKTLPRATFSLMRNEIACEQDASLVRFLDIPEIKPTAYWCEAGASLARTRKKTWFLFPTALSIGGEK